jgi:hypothetical protein
MVLAHLFLPPSGSQFTSEKHNKWQDLPSDQHAERQQGVARLTIVQIIISPFDCEPALFLVKALAAIADERVHIQVL